MDNSFLLALGLAVTVAGIGVDWVQSRTKFTIMDADKIAWVAVGGLWTTSAGAAFWALTSNGLPMLVALLIGGACVALNCYAIQHVNKEFGIFRKPSGEEDSDDGEAPARDDAGTVAVEGEVIEGEPVAPPRDAGPFMVGDDPAPVEKTTPRRDRAA